MTKGKRSRITRLGLILLLPIVINAVEIKWTPAEDTGNNYSQQDRQMLFQLDQQIHSSADPQGTLSKIASTNGIDPSQLQAILEENRRYIEQHKGGGLFQRQEPLTVRVANLVSSVALGTWQMSLKHPRTATIALVVLIFTAWLSWNAPRNGVLLKGGRGPTTLFTPPTDFLESTLLEQEWWHKGSSSSLRSHPNIEIQHVFDQLDAVRKPKDGKKDLTKKKDMKMNSDTAKVDWFSNFRHVPDSDLVKAAFLELTVDLKEITCSDEDEEALFEQVVSEQAGRLLESRPQLTDYVQEHRIRFLSSSGNDDPDFGVLMVPSLGKWGAIGYLPLSLDSDFDGKDDGSQSVLSSLALWTMSGSYWKGQGIFIRIVEKHENGRETPSYVVQVAWAAPKPSRTKRHNTKNLPSKTVERILESLCKSVKMSLETRTKQAWSRQAQSSRLARGVRLSASARRKTRASRERQIEEMAADRRRRRYSQNPNQGRYRPSGERMQSPNNSIDR